MNERAKNYSHMLLNEMNKYNFNKAYKVSVFIEEDDSNVHLSNLNHTPKHTSNRENVPELMNVNESDEIRSIYFHNEKNKESLNITTEEPNDNNNFLIPECSINTGMRNHTQSNGNSGANHFLLPQHGSLNSLHTTMYGDFSSNNIEANAQLKRQVNELHILSINIINILKAYKSCRSYMLKLNVNENLKKKCCEHYANEKKKYFAVCRDIILRVVLPHKQNFNVMKFLNITTHIANQGNINCTYKHVQAVYYEIVSSCYSTLPIHGAMPVYQAPTNNNEYNPTLQRNNNTQLFHNATNSKSQQNYTNDRYTNNIIQPMTNGSQMTNESYSTIRKNSIQNQEIDNITYSVVNGPDSELPQNSQCYRASSNIIHTVRNVNSNNSTLQDQSQNKRSYNNKITTIDNRSNLVLQQSSLNVQHSYPVTQTRSNRPNSTLHEVLKNDKHYNNIAHPVSVVSNLNLQPNNTDDRQSNNEIQKTNENPNSTCQQNYSNQQQYYLDQRLSKVPTTCLFQYRSPDYEIRLDVNTQILNEINNQNQINIDNPSQTKQQNTSDDVSKPVQSTESLNVYGSQTAYHDTSRILLEPRSTSRDSGFMSPCNDQISDLNNSMEVEDPKSLYVTTTEPMEAPTGVCYTCGELTKKKCMGCLDYYYCSEKCQTLHWSIHRHYCINNDKGQKTEQIKK